MLIEKILRHEKLMYNGLPVSDKRFTWYCERFIHPIAKEAYLAGMPLEAMQAAIDKAFKDNPTFFYGNIAQALQSAIDAWKRGNSYRD